MKSAVLELGRRDDPILRRVAADLRKRGTICRVVSNLASARVTVHSTRAGTHCSVSTDSWRLALDDRHTRLILVSDLPVAPAMAGSQQDYVYVQNETYSAWLGLLSSSAARVLNRPAGLPPLSLLPPWTVRTIARGLGVPTVSEYFCAGRELLRTGARATIGACTELSSRRSFWLRDGADRIVDDMNYSVAEIAPEQPAAYVVTVGRAAFFTASQPSAWLAGDRRKAQTGARRIVDHLGLEYAAVAFLMAKGAPLFSRVFTATPPQPPSALVASASRLLSELAQRSLRPE